MITLYTLSFSLIGNSFQHPVSTQSRPINGMSSRMLPPKAETTDWELVVSKGGINIYTRPNLNSGVDEVRITTQIKSSLQGIMALLGDVREYPNWVFKCIMAKRLKTVSEQEYYYYTQSDMPFPMKDRDLVIHSRQWQDKNGVVYSRSEGVPDFISDDENMVRIKSFEANWKIAPAKDGTVDLDYTVKIDPGGNIPAWVSNLVITKGPLKTMENLLEFVSQQKYQQAKDLSYINEK